jgi:hypothetical protein
LLSDCYEAGWLVASTPLFEAALWSQAAGQRVLDSALRAIATNGFHGLSLAQIDRPTVNR